MTKKLIVELFKISESSHPMPVIYCVDDSGQVDRQVSDTLLEFVGELSEVGVDQVLAIVKSVETGTYDCTAPQRPDWSGNAALVWLCPPKVPVGHILVANEYVPEYSEEDGVPQLFTIEQLKLAINTWVSFKTALRSPGASSRMEIQFI